MFGFLKKLVGKSEPAAAPPPAAPPSPVPASAPPAGQPSSKAVMPQTTSKLVPTPLGPGFPKPAAAPAAPVAPAPQVVFSGVTVDLPLKGLWSKLNPAVVQLAQSQPGGKDQLKVPIELVQPMLAKGAVKIPFGQFRKFAPEGLFPSVQEKETLEVEIPLSEVLGCLKPEQLARRAQKKVEVPDDIGPVFGAGGANLRVVDGKAKAPVSSAAPEAPAAAAVAPVETKAPEPAPVPVSKPAPAPIPAATPSPPPTPPPAAVVEQAAPEPIRAPKLDPSLATLKPGVPKPPPTPPVSSVPKPPPAPLAPKLPSVSPPPAAPKLPSMAPAPKPPTPAAAPVPVPAPAPAPAVPVAGSEVFVLPVSDVAPHWAAQNKPELSALQGRSLEIPAGTLEAALKTGKLVFPWREVRGWIRPTEGGLPNLADDFTVDLPLPVVAPKFLQQRGLAKPRKKIEVSEEIPDLFAQKTAAPAAATSAPAAPLPKVPAPPAAPGAKPLLDYGDIFGQPDKKEWTLAEVTQRAAALRGVAGAVIATSDGLLVAGTWPAGVKSEAVAAFIPQMHSRMVQCTKELKLGEPGNLTLMIENVPLQIFKTSSNYLAVLGRAGENLPKAQLTALAMRLGQTQTPK